MAAFPFSDLHSFKDYVGFVALCAPDLFPERERAPHVEQWSLDLAFKGLRLGLTQAREEKGDLGVFSECEALVDDAYSAYSRGELAEGHRALDRVKRLLGKILTE